MYFFHRMLRLCEPLGKKIMFFKNKISLLKMNFRWKSKAPNLRQPKWSACYKESVEAIFRSVNVTFLTWKCLGIVDTPSLYKGRSKGRGVSFQNFQKKGGGSDFSDKNGGVGKIGVIVLKKGSITYFYTY